MPNIPLYRPPGSPLAKAYGASDRNGNPIANKVEKSQDWTPTHQSPDRVALSPLERHAGLTIPDGQRRQQATFQALRAAFSPPSPTPLRRVAKAKGDVSDMIAVYDANGNLLGVCDPADMQALSTGTPAQPAAPSAQPAAQAAPAQPAADPADMAPATVAKVLKAAKALGLGLKPVRKSQGPQPTDLDELIIRSFR